MARGAKKVRTVQKVKRPALKSTIDIMRRMVEVEGNVVKLAQLDEKLVKKHNEPFADLTQ